MMQRGLKNIKNVNAAVVLGSARIGCFLGGLGVVLCWLSKGCPWPVAWWVVHGGVAWSSFISIIIRIG